LTTRRAVGLHLRLLSTYTELIERARTHDVPFFQFFLAPEKHRRLLEPSDEDRRRFLQQRPAFERVYIHSSYWTNPASGNPKIRALSEHIISRELHLAHSLQADAVIIHPGSATRHPHGLSNLQKKQNGMHFLVNLLNKITSGKKMPRILIENGAHANTSLCSDLKDFIRLKKFLRHPLTLTKKEK